MDVLRLILIEGLMVKRVICSLLTFILGNWLACDSWLERCAVTTTHISVSAPVFSASTVCKKLEFKLL